MTFPVFLMNRADRRAGKKGCKANGHLHKSRPVIDPMTNQTTSMVYVCVNCGDEQTERPK